MAKYIADTVVDLALNYIKNNAILYCLDNAAPSNYSEATTGAKYIGSKSVTSTDFTTQAGSGTGRKVTVGAITGITITNSGTITYVALCTGSVLLFYTTTTSQAVTAGNTVNTAAFDWEITSIA